jgi:hypothetical protein
MVNGLAGAGMTLRHRADHVQSLLGELPDVEATAAIARKPDQMQQNAERYE